MKPTPDWDTLIQKHLDGQMTEEEAQALSARIVEDAEVRSRYLKAAQGHIAKLDAAITASAFLQRTYTFDATRVDPEPSVSKEEAAMARTEDFIQ